MQGFLLVSKKCQVLQIFYFESGNKNIEANHFLPRICTSIYAMLQMAHLMYEVDP